MVLAALLEQVFYDSSRQLGGRSKVFSLSLLFLKNNLLKIINIQKGIYFGLANSAPRHHRHISLRLFFQGHPLYEVSKVSDVLLSVS